MLQRLITVIWSKQCRQHPLELDAWTAFLVRLAPGQPTAALTEASNGILAYPSLGSNSLVPPLSRKPNGRADGDPFATLCSVARLRQIISIPEGSKICCREDEGTQLGPCTGN